MVAVKTTPANLLPAKVLDRRISPGVAFFAWQTVCNKRRRHSGSWPVVTRESSAGGKGRQADEWCTAGFSARTDVAGGWLVRVWTGF